MKTWILLGLVSAVAFSGCAEEGYYSEHHEEYSEHEEAYDEGASSSGVTVQDCDEAYPDADPRFHSHIEGEEESSRTIHVERRGGLLVSSDVPLKVSAIFTITGNAEIELRDPTGKVLRSESFQGQKDLEEEDWFQTEDALPGDWTLDIRLMKDEYGRTPSGAYTFGATVG